MGVIYKIPAGTKFNASYETEKSHWVQRGMDPDDRGALGMSVWTEDLNQAIDKGLAIMIQTF